MTSKIFNSIILSMLLFSFLTYLYSDHPMILATLVIFQCMLIASLISSKSMFTIFSFFMVIVYLGGILMLFSYIISLINSLTPILKINKSSLWMVVTYFFSNLYSNKQSYLEVTTSKFTELAMSSYSQSFMKTSLFLMTLLLLIMVIVVFMTESSKGNMRKI